VLWRPCLAWQPRWDITSFGFVNPAVERYPGIEEDEPPVLRLISEKRA
jgi:hypothetical protein